MFFTIQPPAYFMNFHLKCFCKSPFPLSQNHDAHQSRRTGRLVGTNNAIYTSFYFLSYQSVVIQHNIFIWFWLELQIVHLSHQGTRKTEVFRMVSRVQCILQYIYSIFKLRHFDKFCLEISQNYVRKVGKIYTSIF